jgi:hypothetical protein
MVLDMGGVGSASWDRSGTKNTVESHNHLDVNNRSRKGLLEPGTRGRVSWSKGDDSLGFVSFELKDGFFVLDYRYRRNSSEQWEEVRYPVRLSWTPCNFGGSRPWFVCPGVVNGHYCGRRVAKLYGAGKYFLCRYCYDLTYESRKDGQKNRALHKCQRIRQRLGGSANMSEPFPPKPKGMHFDTYLKLWREHDRADREYTRRMILDLAVLRQRL